MQLSSHTLTWITISMCELCVNICHRLKNLYPKQLVLGPSEQIIINIIQLYSHALIFITISVYVLRADTCRRMKTYILNSWSWDQSEDNQYGPESNYKVKQ
jgi:hypothetical protein